MLAFNLKPSDLEIQLRRPYPITSPWGHEWTRCNTRAACIGIRRSQHDQAKERELHRTQAWLGQLKDARRGRTHACKQSASPKGLIDVPKAASRHMHAGLARKTGRSFSWGSQSPRRLPLQEDTFSRLRAAQVIGERPLVQRSVDLAESP